jgi:phosphoribosylamine--glycine ligase
MKILIIGSGGREHALALALLRDGAQLFAWPGSDALGQISTLLDPDVDVVEWCASHRPDLVVVGPEAPLVEGLADRLRARGLAVFGHGAATARLEGSKAFAKAFMARHGIPCAASESFTDLAAGEAAIRAWPHGYPIVLKADGLAAGKGVVLAATEAEALRTLREFLAGAFGEASRTVLLEAPLAGMELSLHVLVDVDASHAACAVLPPCQDHKRIFEEDQGPNTGGMGAFGPIPFLRPEDLARMRRELVEPTVAGLRAEGLEARGVLFLGVMWTAQGPRLLEYNVRFGDPETQVLMQLLDEDLPALLMEVAQGRLVGRELKVRPGCAIAVVLAAEGYPGTPRTGVPILLGETGVTLIHAGTALKNGRWVTKGGRVLDLCVLGEDLAGARAKVAGALEQVGWPGMQVRRDIGLRSLNHARAGRTVADPWGGASGPPCVESRCRPGTACPGGPPDGCFHHLHPLGPPPAQLVISDTPPGAYNGSPSWEEPTWTRHS